MELYDEYGRSLRVGQRVAIAISDTVVLRGTILEIDSDLRTVYCEIEWPVGKKDRYVCNHYGKRNEEYYMSQLLVLDLW